jgi:hypothetical protein
VIVALKVGHAAPVLVFAAYAGIHAFRRSAFAYLQTVPSIGAFTLHALCNVLAQAFAAHVQGGRIVRPRDPIPISVFLPQATCTTLIVVLATLHSGLDLVSNFDFDELTTIPFATNRLLAFCSANAVGVHFATELQLAENTGVLETAVHCTDIAITTIIVNFAALWFF